MKVLRNTGESSLRALTRSIGSQDDICFIWIPKNAGTALYQQFKCAFGMKLIKSEKALPRKVLSGAYSFCHLHYLSLLRMGVISSVYHDNAYKFCISRNPYTRAVSLFNYLLKDESFSDSFVASKKFNKFLEEVRGHRPPIGVYNHQGLSQTNPQVDWIYGPSGSYLVDRVYSFECLETVKSELYKKYKKEINTGYTANVSNPRFYSRSAEALLSSDRAINFIQEIYVRDFEGFNYSYDVEKAVRF